jgi:CBS domain-containing protein
MASENVGSVPVVADTETKRLVGIVTARDLTVKVLAERRDPQATHVDQVMTTDPPHQVRRILLLMILAA